MNPVPHESGFSLVETLVALAVIASMTGLLFETVSANASFARTVAKKREAMMIAQSLLAQMTVPGGVGAMAEQGSMHGIGWRVIHSRRGGGARDGGAPLEEVRIVVADQATGHDLSNVRTLRLVR